MREAPEVLEIGGARYVATEGTGITVRQREFALGLLERCGAATITVDADASAEDWVRAVILKLSAATQAMTFVGAVLVPEEIGVANWSPKIAEETGEKLRNLPDADHGQSGILFSMLGVMIAGFIEAKWIVVMSSRTSFVTSGDAGPLRQESSMTPSGI